MDDSGIVYVLKNPYMYCVYKIGMTRLSVSKRIKSLRNTSIPADFEELISFNTDHALQLEKYLHRKLSINRIRNDREFFSFKSDQAIVSLVSEMVSKFEPRDYTNKEKINIEVENNNSTPSQQAKAAGLKNLAVVQELTGQSAQTLGNWCRDKPKLFKVVLEGCRALTDRCNTDGNNV